MPTNTHRQRLARCLREGAKCLGLKLTDFTVPHDFDPTEPVNLRAVVGKRDCLIICRVDDAEWSWTAYDGMEQSGSGNLFKAECL